MSLRPLLAISSLLLAAACSSTPSTPRGSAEPAWAAPPLEHSVSVRDGRTGQRLSFERMLDELAEADVVFVGETHIDETTHRVEWAVYEGLLQRRDGEVVLAMEMFERDVQPVLNQYLSGDVGEDFFLAHSRPWGNYATSYRPMIEKARSLGKPVVAANFPRPLTRRIAMEGSGVLDQLGPTERAQLPAEFFPNPPAYWKRVDNAVRGHLGMMGGTSDEDRLWSTQCLWDNAMGEACAKALDEHPGSMVVHVNGGFHTAYWDGTVHQFRQRNPDAKVLTLDISPTSNPQVGEVGGAPRADYVVFAESRARDLNDGSYGVSVSTSLDYLLHLPATATAEAPVPLLIWLVEDGLRAQDGLDLWKGRLGEEVAIAVLEPPYRAVQADLGEGGRWYWPDDFSSDIGTAQQAIERLWGYVLRHHPVDPARVCLAGEGSGATVASALTLFTDRMDLQSVALAPRQYSRIKDFPLPLPELQGGDPVPARSLHVLGGVSDQEWWASELAAYEEVGLSTEWVDLQGDLWARETQQEALLRSALGLEAPARPRGARAHVVVDSELPRARLWARLLAQREARERGGLVALVSAPVGAEFDSTAISTTLAPADLPAGAIPLCPGPFGGTTVLVLPDDLDEATRQAWMDLVEDDPVAKRSRFHRTRIATLSGDQALPTVLATLREENRSNVLIVPAVFCADDGWMRELVRSAKGEQDAMTLQWLPGLGGAMGEGAHP